MRLFKNPILTGDKIDIFQLHEVGFGVFNANLPLLNSFQLVLELVYFSFPTSEVLSDPIINFIVQLLNLFYHSFIQRLFSGQQL